MIKRIISVMLSLFTLITFSFNTYAESAQEKIARLEKEKNAVSENIKQKKQEQNATINEKERMIADVSIIEKEIEKIQNDINVLNSEKEKVEQQLKDNEIKLETEKLAFKKRIRKMSMLGISTSDLTMASLLLKDTESSLSGLQFSKNISQYNKKMIKNIVNRTNEINKQKEAIDIKSQNMEIKKATCEKKRKVLSQNIDILNAKYAKNSQGISELNNQSTYLQKEINAAKKQYENEIYQEYLKQKRIEEEKRNTVSEIKNTTNNSTNSSNSTTPSASAKTSFSFIWPLPGYKYITSGFGQRLDPITKEKIVSHGGIDISGYNVNSKPIVASCAGTITIAKNNPGGYGNYVMVSHGFDKNGDYYSTVYGHMTNYIVSVGQKVTAGQIIGYVGSTGASTGPHLHFEIRKNNVRIDPTLYVK